MSQTIYSIADELGLRVQESEPVGDSFAWSAHNPEVMSDLALLALGSPAACATMEGRLDGVGIRATTSGRDSLRVVAPLVPALDLGLLVVSSSSREGYDAKRLAATPVVTRSTFEARCDEAHRLRGWEEVLATLDALDPAGIAWILEDGGLGATLFRPTTEQVRALVAVAGAVERLRDQLPMAAATAPHRAAWSAMADAHGWTLGTTPLRVAGSDGPVSVRARIERIAGGFALEVKARYRVPLEDWVGVDDRSEHVGWFSWNKDPIAIRPGGADAASALPAQARLTLRSLATQGDVAMHDAGLDVRVPLPASPDASVSVVRDALAIATGSWEAATGGAAGPPTASIYRVTRR